MAGFKMKVTPEIEKLTRRFARSIPAWICLFIGKYDVKRGLA